MAATNTSATTSTTTLDVHLHNLQSNIPPSLRSSPCFPNSTSTFLRNILLTNVTLNLLLFPSTLLSVGVRYMGGFTILGISFTSCVHISIMCMVLGNHIADAVSKLGIFGNSARLANTLRNASSRYGSNVFLYGALFGSTVVMAMLMHVVHVYYSRVADCVVTHAAHAAGNSGSGTFHLTGGYANENGQSNHNGGSMIAFDPFTTCGASGPVKLVCFLSGLIGWSNAILAVTLYAKREELLGGDGGVGGSGSSNQYDEIGGVGTQPPDNGGGFAGDFPPEHGMRTMQV